MLSRLIPSLCALAVVSTPALAQDIGTPIPNPPQQSAPAQPTEYVKEVYTDWQMRCLRVEGAADPCELYQLLREPDGQPVAQVSIIVLPESNGQIVAVGNVITPLDTLLSEDLRIAVDGGEARAYRFSYCTERGCVAQIGLLQETIDAFRGGTGATITITPLRAQNQIVTLPLSLSGFTAGHNALLAYTEENAG